MAERKEVGGYRQFTGVWDKVIGIAATLFCLYQGLYLLGVLSTRYFFIPEERHMPLTLGMGLVFAFLFLPGRKGQGERNKLPWYDILFMITIMVSVIYIAINAIEIIAYRAEPTFPELILGTLTLLIALEGVRRSVGISLTFVVLFMIFYALFTNLFPGPFWGPGNSWSRLIAQIWLFQSGMFGAMLRIIATYIILFVMLGAMLNAMGGGKFFLDLALALTGHLRGGPAKVAIVASSLFGTMSGSAVANVATTGVITIPMMKRIGYKPYYAGAVEAVASTGGIYMPPVMGMTAFIMADFMGVSYWSICVAAFVPAILYYIALFTQVHLEAVKVGMTGLPRDDMPSAKRVLLGGWYYVVPLAVLVYFLAVMGYSATTSCLYAIGSMLVVGMIKKESRWTPSRLVDAFKSTVRILVRIFPLTAATGTVLACLEITGLPLTLSGLLLDLSGGNIFILLVFTAAACYIFGMGLPSMVAYVMMAILVAPALIKAGIPLYAAHLFIFYFAASHVITPPLGGAFFLGAAIADAPMMRTGFQAMRLGIVAYIVPFAFVYSSALLLQGPPLQILVAVGIAVVAVVSLGIGLEGQLVTRTGWLRRFLFVAGGFSLFVPTGMVKIAGIIAIALAVLPEVVAFVRTRRAMIGERQ